MNAICRFLMNAVLRARHRSLLAIALLIPFLVALPASKALAISQDDAIDFAVEAAARGGQYLGLSIPEDAKELLKELVKCGANGTPVTDCAKQSLINVLLKNVPDDAKKMVGCLLGGGDAMACAKQAGLDNLPPQAKPVVECMLGGGTVAACAGKAALGEALAKVPANVRPLLECIAGGKSPADCGAQALASNLPAGEAKDVALCIANGGSPEACAMQFGKGVVDEATKKETADLVEKLKGLKADAEQAMNEQEGSVKSIIEIAKGIQTDDWAKVIYFGGKEFAKIVLTVLVEVLCPPCALIAGPVVAALVDLYGGLAEDVFKMVTTGDLGALPEVLFEFYFRELIARPCALLPDGGFKDAVCGTLAKVIAAAAGVFGDAVGFVLGVAEDVLKAVGIWQVGDAIVGFFGNIIDEIFGDGLEDPKVCGRADAFFAANYLPCLGAAAGASAATSPMANLHSACVNKFKPCYGDKAGEICDGLDKALNDQAQQVNAALEQGARNYTPAIGAFIYGRRAQFCVNSKQNSVENFRQQMPDFTQQCTDALSKNVPLQVAACTAKPASVTRPPGPVLACGKAVDNSGWQQMVENTCEQWCRESRNNCPPPPPPCWVHGNTVVESYGFYYSFSALERNICVAKFPSVLDKIWAVINPPNVIYDRRHVTDILQNPAVRLPAWSGSVTAALGNVATPGLSLGNCRATRTMLAANVQWLKTPVRTRLTQAQVLQAPLSDASRAAAVSNMFAIRPMPAVAESLQLSLTPVALVPSFESCPATASPVSRGSSGSDGSYTPRNTVTRTPARGTGGASTVRAAPQGTSGSYLSRNNPMDRLSGDGQGGGVSSGYRLPDTARGPMPGSQPASRGSSGASTAQPGGSRGSSGASTVQSSGTSVPRRSQGSSGVSMPAGGPGVSGTFGPGAGSGGTLRNTRPSSIEILRRPQDPPPTPLR